jgi:hypothetical protein
LDARVFLTLESSELIAISLVESFWLHRKVVEGSKLIQIKLMLS